VATIKPLAKTSPDQHLPALTGLRFYLAVWVVIHHLSGGARMLEPWVRNFPDPVQNFLRSGFWAVGTFFILSGFVLARGYASNSWNRTSLVRYAAARVARIYPVYGVSLLIIAPIAYSNLFGQDGAFTPAGKAALLANYTLLLQGWTGTLPVHWNTPAWSLSCELFFYLCFPLILLLVRCTSWRRSLAVAGVALGLPILWRPFGLSDSLKPLLHLGDFLLGVALAGVYDALIRSCPRLAGRGYRLYLPSLALFIVLVSFSRAVERWVPLDTLLRPLVALLLLGLALGGGLVARLLSIPPSVLLGKASYAMYILHVPLLWWYKRSPVFRATAASPPGASVIFIAGVIVISILVFKLVEEPANRLLRRKLVSWMAPLVDSGLCPHSPWTLSVSRSLRSSFGIIPSSPPALAVTITTTVGPIGPAPAEPSAMRASGSGGEAG
jgi:peptidoglycan/LPS O-acetylase OafA/YrhL